MSTKQQPNPKRPQMTGRHKTVYAMPKGQDYVTREQAEDKMRKKFEMRANDKKTELHGGKKYVQFGAKPVSKTLVARETRAAKNTLGPAAIPKEYVDTDMDDEQCMEAEALEAHLRDISPFNGRWEINKTISAGTYGVAFFVQDNKTRTPAVIKVARQHGNDIGNSVAEWEGFVLEKLFKADQTANIVRLLDKGMLQDQQEQQLEFIAMEVCSKPVRDYLSENTGEADRQYRVTRVALGSLKGLFDMHKQGLLHRDMKPENMGMINSDGQWICCLYDLGMARIYTDADGYLRPPRTVVTFRGTPEWASGNAAKGREQTRFDDLVSWFYVIIELFDPASAEVSQTAFPFPWDFCPENSQAMAYMKTLYLPARLLLKNCPSQFYTLNTYLMCANRLKVPDYVFIANLVAEAMEQFKQQADEKN